MENAAGSPVSGGNGQFQETGNEHAVTGSAGWLAADQQVINRHLLTTVALPHRDGSRLPAEWQKGLA